MEDDLRDSREQECQAAKTTKKSGARPRALELDAFWRSGGLFLPQAKAPRRLQQPPVVALADWTGCGGCFCGFFLATPNVCSGGESEKDDELQRGGARRCCSGFFISSSELSVQHNMSKPGRLRPTSATSFPGDGNSHDVERFSFSQRPRFRRGLLEIHAAARVNAA